MALIRELRSVLARVTEAGERRERDKTGRIADREFASYPPKCAVCGTPCSFGNGVPLADDPRILVRKERAHILPLWQASTTTAENLILLCDGSNLRKVLKAVLPSTLEELEEKAAVRFSQIVAEAPFHGWIGCHQLFDCGCIRTNDIQSVRSQVRQDRSSWGTFRMLRDTALETTLASVTEVYSPADSNNLRLLRNLNGLLGSDRAAFDKARGENRVALLRAATMRNVTQAIKLLSSCRRTGSERSRRLGRVLYSCLEPVSDPSSLHLYELALFLEAYPQDDAAHRQAQEFLRLSMQAAEREVACSDIEHRPAREVKQAHSEVAFLLFTILPRLAISAREAEAWALSLHACASKLDRRGKINCQALLTQLNLKCGNVPEARSQLNKAWEYRHQATISEGWSAFQGIHLTALSGMVSARENSFETALRLLFRATNQMSTAYGERPDGFNDVAHCAAWVLKSMGRKEADDVTLIARQMVDHHSGAWLATV